MISCYYRFWGASKACKGYLISGTFIFPPITRKPWMETTHCLQPPPTAFLFVKYKHIVYLQVLLLATLFSGIWKILSFCSIRESSTMLTNEVCWYFVTCHKTKMTNLQDMVFPKACGITNIHLSTLNFLVLSMHLLHCQVYSLVWRLKADNVGGNGKKKHADVY